MAWVAPSTRTTGDLITAAIWNADVVANPIELRAGGIAIASQAAGDYVYASSASQLARLAAVAGKAPQYSLASAWGMQYPVADLLKANSGSDTTVGATNVDTVALTNLDGNDRLLIHTVLQAVTQPVAGVFAYNSTDSVQFGDLTDQAGSGNLTAGQICIGTFQAAPTQNSAVTIAGISTAYLTSNASRHQGSSGTFTTAWTGAWTLALRHGGVTAGGTLRWRWQVWRVQGRA